MRRHWITMGACLAFLAAAPGFAVPSPAGDKGATAVDDSRSDGSFVATVLERKSAELTLQKDNGEVVFLSFNEPGLTVQIDRAVTKGSRVKVTEESTSMSRTLIVQLAPAN